MSNHQTNRGIDVIALHCIDNGDVCLHRRVPIGLLSTLGQRQRRHGHQATKKTRQGSIACQFGQLQVELAGKPNGGSVLAKGAESPLFFNQFAQCFKSGRLLLAGKLNQHAFGQAPCVEYLAGLFGVRYGNFRALMRAQDDDLLMGQLGQRPTYLAAARAEHLHQTLFCEATGRGEALIQDCFEYLGVGVVLQCFVAKSPGKRRGGRDLAIILQ